MRSGPRGRGGGAGRSRGRGRGGRGGPRGRSRGAAAKGDANGRTKKAYNAAPASDDENDTFSEQELNEEQEEIEDSEEVDIEEEGEEEEDAAAKPYAALLQSLKASMKEDNGDGEGRKPKRRKLEVETIDQQDGPNGDAEEASSQSEDENNEKDDNKEDKEEEEEEREDEQEQIGNDSDSDGEDIADPFETHFNSPSPATLRKALESAKRNEWHTTKTIQLTGDVGRLIISMPAATVEPAHMDYVGKKIVKSISELKIKPKLHTPSAELTEPLQRALAPTVFSYTDLLYTTRTVENTPHLRQLYTLHVLNHLFKTWDRILKNNAKLAKYTSLNNPDPPDPSNPPTAPTLPPDLRDQGFTRPKILILAPTRHQALTIINNHFIKLLQPTQQENHKRFLDSFSLPADTSDPIPTHKPADFRALFEGNHDDMFTLGIKLTKKTIRYFTKFTSSDIIVASPLGLRMAIGASEEEAAFADERETKKKRKGRKQDFDFLSSIEICIVDHADAILMQNWEHLEFCFKHLNKLPVHPLPDTDFSRVREWCLDGHAGKLRQTMVLTNYLSPEMKKFETEYMQNLLSGKVRQGKPRWDGEMLVSVGQSAGHLGISVPQIFNRFDSGPTPQSDPDARFEYFTTKLLPAYLTHLRHLRRQHRTDSSSTPNRPGGGDGGGLLIFIPSYFDFLRLRTFLSHPLPNSPLSAHPIPSFGAISEDTPPGEVARARSHFLSGRYSLLLYSGRAHHFRRYVIKGVGEVCLYGVPQEREFYREVGELVASGLRLRGERGETGGVGMASWGGKVRTVFSKYDGLALERIVGTERAAVMLASASGKGNGDVFEFV